MTKQIYIHVQDFVDAYIGPFEDTPDIDARVAAHLALCSARGDSAEFIGIVSELPADAFVMTEAEDLAYDVEADVKAIQAAAATLSKPYQEDPQADEDERRYAAN